MSKGQKLRALVNERLTAAAAEIFELFERTIAEYEQEVLRFKQTNDTQQQLLAAVLEPTLHSHTTAVQTVLENPEGTIKQEQNIKHEEEQLQEVSFFTPVCVKTEDDEDKSFVLHQRPTEENREETNGEDCGAEAGCSSDPLTQLHSDSEEHTADHSEDRTLHWEPPAHHSAAQKEAAVAEGQWSPFSGSERGRSRDAESSPETRAAAMNPDSSVMGGNSKPCRCSECGTAFPQGGEFFRHMLTHMGQKPYTLSVHQEGRPQADANTEERPFSCPYCHKTFLHNCSLVIHMRVHTGDKPYSCPICNKSFLTNIYLKTHLRTHTGEKPFCCPFCQRGFAQKCNLRAHVRIHTGERPYSCSVCKKTFRQKWNLKMHLRTHKTEPVPSTSGFLMLADTDF